MKRINFRFTIYCTIYVCIIIISNIELHRYRAVALGAYCHCRKATIGQWLLDCHPKLLCKFQSSDSMSNNRSLTCGKLHCDIRHNCIGHLCPLIDRQRQSCGGWAVDTETGEPYLLLSLQPYRLQRDLPPSVHCYSEHICLFTF